MNIPTSVSDLLPKNKSELLTDAHVKKLCDNLFTKDEAIDYLTNKRNLSLDTIKHFKLGYNDGNNSISIPCYRRGEVVAIKYRSLDEDSEVRYSYEKGGQNWIYNEDGLDIGREKGYVAIVEGEFDCMSAWQAGIKNICSPASGKDSYGAWIELLDTIPKIYIAYDNDDGGREASLKMSERLGTDKCFEIKYPDGIKDANEFFKKHSVDEFKAIAKKATPFYKYEFKGMGEIINSLRFKQDETIQIKCIPKVKFEKDWVCIISGVSNVGKTSYVLNIADELTSKGIPTLILPFERGIESVGKRFLQVKFDKTVDQFGFLDNDEWDKIIKVCGDTPAYFALPQRKDIVSTIVKSKRLFDTRVVIIDHLDYIIRNVQGNKEQAIADTLQALKRIAEENRILFMIVTHIRKIEGGHAMIKRKPTMEDLKGSSSLYQDPEVVVMLTRPEEDKVEVNVLKNKGDMGDATFGFKHSTGHLVELDEFGDMSEAIKIPKINIEL